MPFAAFLLELFGVGFDFLGGLSIVQMLGLSAMPAIGVALWKVATEAQPSAGQPQTAVQQATGGVGAAVGGVGAGLGGFGQFIAQNPWLVIGGVAALVLLRR